MRKTSLNQVYELAKKDKRVLFISSDLGPDVLLSMKKEMPNQTNKIIRMAIPDKFSDRYGSQDQLLDYWGLSVKDIIIKMKKALA